MMFRVRGALAAAVIWPVSHDRLQRATSACDRCVKRRRAFCALRCGCVYFPNRNN